MFTFLVCMYIHFSIVGERAYYYALETMLSLHLHKSHNYYNIKLSAYCKCRKNPGEYILSYYGTLSHDISCSPKGDLGINQNFR